MNPWGGLADRSGVSRRLVDCCTAAEAELKMVTKNGQNRSLMRAAPTLMRDREGAVCRKKWQPKN